MNAKDYDEYLKRLADLVWQELVPKMALFDYFTRHACRIDDDPVDVEPLLWFFQSGLHYDLTLSLARLFDAKADRSIIDFLNVTEKCYSSLPWKSAFDANKIAEHRRELGSIASTLDRLRKRRNKFFAHYDKKFFLDPECLEIEYPFTNEDAITLVQALQSIVGYYYGVFYGHHRISMEGAFYIAAERLYSKLRASAKSDGA